MRTLLLFVGAFIGSLGVVVINRAMKGTAFKASQSVVLAGSFEDTESAAEEESFVGT